MVQLLMGFFGHESLRHFPALRAWPTRTTPSDNHANTSWLHLTGRMRRVGLSAPGGHTVPTWHLISKVFQGLVEFQEAYKFSSWNLFLWFSSYNEGFIYLFISFLHRMLNLKPALLNEAKLLRQARDFSLPKHWILLTQVILLVPPECSEKMFN